MTNLVQELGRDYFNSRFAGSFFLKDDVAHIVGSAERNNTTVVCTAVKGTVSKPSASEISIPNEFFADMSVFAVPDLGWRSANNGRYLAFTQRTNRSYRRGVSAENIQRTLSPMTEWLANVSSLNLDYYNRSTTVAKLVMEPSYLTLSEGLMQLNEGRIASFCISPNLAVYPEDEDTLALMFNLSKIGTVKLDGTVTCTVPNITL